MIYEEKKPWSTAFRMDVFVEVVRRILHVSEFAVRIITYVYFGRILSSHLKVRGLM